MSPSVSVHLLLTQSDARLVELAREGHERAFEALVQRYRRPLLSAPLIARVAEAGAGGGSVGLGGALLKGGAIAVTAGALAGGIVATRHAATHHRPASSPSSRQVLLAQANDALAGAAGDDRQRAQVGANGQPTDGPAHAVPRAAEPRR